MKVLWITNIAFAHHQQMLGLQEIVTGGSWLYAAYDGAKRSSDVQLHIATSSNVKQLLKSESEGNFFYILPGGGTRGYDIDSADNLDYWKNLRSEVEPDLVIVWGTECRFSYVAMKAMEGLRIAIYMQGVIRSIYGHYFEGVPDKYRLCTIRDVMDKLDSNSQLNSYKTQVALEKEMLKMATAVIVENDWCEDLCKNINQRLKVYRNLLPIREVFYTKTWDINKMERHSIFTNAGGYPIKGHHILFQALSIVKKQIPNFKCYIPGTPLSVFDSVKRRNGYIKWLLNIIKDNHLESNIVFTGNLTSEKMVDRIACCNVYVMPSIMENHSSSLIEAMISGAPCVSSLVGGTASIVNPKVNAILYNSLDYESLAGSIIRIFEDDDLATKLSSNALKIRDDRRTDFGEEMSIIYKDLMH